MITDSYMKIQSWILAGVIASLSAVAGAQDRAAASKDKVAAARENVLKRADALTEEQIKQSRNLGSLAKLAQVYNAQHDTQHLIWVLQRAGELMPNSGDLKLQLALAYAQADDKTHAYDTLVRMQMQGFGYDIAHDPRFAPIHGTKVWDYLVANIANNAQPFGEGKPAFDLPKGDNAFSALAWDAKRNQFLVASARDGSVKLADAKGKLTDFIVATAENGLWGVDALAVDADHGKLYVASSASPLYKQFTAETAGKAGIFEFDLGTGKMTRKAVFGERTGAHRLTSLVVDKSGQVYAADGARKELYKLEGAGLKEILVNPKLTGISALALSGDGRTLYLADFALGIYGYDLSKGQAFEPRYNASNMILGGIVDMHWFDNTLTIVQDGMNPKRVMRLSLTKDGRDIAGAMPLDVAQPTFAALGSGVVAGDKLYFVANRQDPFYDSHGVLTDADKLEPVHVFASNLRFAWGQNGIGAGLAPLAGDATISHKAKGAHAPDAAAEKQ
jgi:sugar lactone lactonase YvrE